MKDDHAALLIFAAQQDDYRAKVTKFSCSFYERSLSLLRGGLMRKPGKQNLPLESRSTEKRSRRRTIRRLEPEPALCESQRSELRLVAPDRPAPCASVKQLGRAAADAQRPPRLGNVVVPDYANLDLRFDRATLSAWVFLNPRGLPCFSPSILDDIAGYDLHFEANQGLAFDDGILFEPEYAIVASRHPTVFSLGGDLALFLDLIARRDRDGLLAYARACIESVWQRLQHYGGRVTTIALVQGDALGGGFECVLANDIIVAEEQARMGFPEILFNLFPGMGAYSLLARRLGPIQAERMIASGATYSAADLKQLGVVDLVVPPGAGIQATDELILSLRKRAKGLRAMYRCREVCAPVSLDELLRIGEIWSDAALCIDPRDQRLMQRLVHAQGELVERASG